MQHRDMRVPRSVRDASSSKRMIRRQTQVVRQSLVHEGEPAGRTGVPGVSRNHVERGLQLRFKRTIHAPNLRLELRSIWPFGEISPASIAAPFGDSTTSDGPALAVNIFGRALTR